MDNQADDLENILTMGTFMSMRIRRNITRCRNLVYFAYSIQIMAAFARTVNSKSVRYKHLQGLIVQL